MNGVPVDLPVQSLVGREVTHIGLAMHQLKIHFDGGALIDIEGSWNLRDRTGKVIDQQCDPPAERDVYRIHRLLSQAVTAASIDAPRSFTLTFASGDALTVLDDSPQYESFSLRVDGRELHI